MDGSDRRLPVPIPNPVDPDLFYKMKKIEGLSYSIHEMRKRFRKPKGGWKPGDAPTMYDAMSLQHLEQQRKELWGTLPPLKLVKG